ncbi:MAG: hypothetical protein IJ719_10400 [Clostridia bacterium]|nr:hypothetical protein [Clostridia bacterium]
MKLLSDCRLGMRDAGWRKAAEKMKTLLKRTLIDGVHGVLDGVIQENIEHANQQVGYYRKLF